MGKNYKFGVEKTEGAMRYTIYVNVQTTAVVKYSSLIKHYILLEDSRLLVSIPYYTSKMREAFEIYKRENNSNEDHIMKIPRLRAPALQELRTDQTTANRWVPT